MVAGFLKGFREATQQKTKPTDKKPAPTPTEKEHDTTPAKPTPDKKPQQPTKEQLVKEAVDKAAKANPVEVVPQRRGVTAVGDVNKIRLAADELAAALKDYDPESMHQLVKEMPQLGEALTAVSQGFRQVASRAESEWPVAAPVAEGLRSIADDIKAGAGTAEQTRGTIRRENETDIERGEAPRHGSIESERKWNV